MRGRASGARRANLNRNGAKRTQALFAVRAALDRTTVYLSQRCGPGLGGLRGLRVGVKLTEDPATRVVALKIIELAQRGVIPNFPHMVSRASDICRTTSGSNAWPERNPRIGMLPDISRPGRSSY
jgi:hypothetical protein